ncbi:hypothetical protein ACKLNR_008387 [Fusarium oxysporum f. sp. zingiberi]
MKTCKDHALVIFGPFLLPLLQYADRNSGSLNQDEAVLGRCHYQAPRADAIHPSDTGFPGLCLKFCKSMTDLVKSSKPHPQCSAYVPDIVLCNRRRKHDAELGTSMQIQRNLPVLQFSQRPSAA